VPHPFSLQDTHWTSSLPSSNDHRGITILRIYCPRIALQTAHRHLVLQRILSNMVSVVRVQLLRQVAHASRGTQCMSKASPITSSILRSTTSKASKPAFIRDSLPRVAAFHTTARRDILPPLPRMSTILGPATTNTTVVESNIARKAY